MMCSKNSGNYNKHKLIKISLQKEKASDASRSPILTQQIFSCLVNKSLSVQPPLAVVTVFTYAFICQMVEFTIVLIMHQNI